jgi:putative ABC transport system permease protein
VGTALATGLLFGVMPARRAAALDPVQALMKR